MAKRPTTIDEYLDGISADKRATLNKVRKAIKAAAPGAVEGISYGIPAFRMDGRMLMWFGASTNHCSVYPGAYPIKALKDELAGYVVSKGTVRFPVNKPLPASLINKLVKARISEYAAKKKR
jgi:uncharacterized protein YdhG (YjbR/CyaY superfamily)